VSPKELVFELQFQSQLFLKKDIVLYFQSRSHSSYSKVNHPQGRMLLLNSHLSKLLLILPLLFTKTYAALDFSNYPIGSQACLYSSAAQSICGAFDGLAFNQCACSSTGNFIQLAVQCISRAGDAGDLQIVWQTANTNCALSNTPLAYSLAQFLAFAPTTTTTSSTSSAGVASSSLSTSTNPASTPSTSSTSAVASSTSGSSSGAITSAGSGASLSTGAIVGLVIGVLIILGVVAVTITLFCIHRRKKKVKQVNQQTQGVTPTASKYIPPSAVPGVMPMAGYGGPPPQSNLNNTPYYQPSASDPRYSIYSNGSNNMGDYQSALPQYTPAQSQPYVVQGQTPVYPTPAQYQSSGASIISPISQARSSPAANYIEMDNSHAMITPTSAPDVHHFNIQSPSAGQHDAVHEVA